ncbi:MAG: SDR family NAD(P)-dependent oxidoreductase [Litorilinea sp.]
MSSSVSNFDPALLAHFAQKTVLITGATDGIGRALAEQLAPSGARLVLVGRRDPGELDAAFFDADRYCRADLAQPASAAQVEGWLDAQGIDRLDYVIHNAGQGYVGRLSEQLPAALDALLAVNVLAPMRLTHALFGRVAAAHGRFVYISSLAAGMPVADYAAYGASKAALEGFVRNFQCELDALGSPVGTAVLRVAATRTGMHPKSGATKARMDWEAFAPVEKTAQAIVRILVESPARRTWTQGTGARILQAVGTYLPGLVTQVAARSANRTLLEVGAQIFGAATDDPVTLEPAVSQPDVSQSDTLQAGVSPLVVQKKGEAARHCVITGAAAGIGRALALRYGAAGYTITGVDVDRDAAMRTQAELINQGVRARFVVADLAQGEHLDAIATRLAERPPIDVMIHCAGISAVGHFPALDWSAQEKVVAINLVAPLQLTQRVLAAQRLRPGASLVYIASLAHYTGYPGAAVYGGTKSGIAAFGRSLGVACARAGVHVLTVFPGPVRTEHARRYSPDNRRENRRMPPEKVATAIYRAVERRQSILFPGVAARVFAGLGTWLPRVSEWAMRRTIFDKLANTVTDTETNTETKTEEEATR